MGLYDACCLVTGVSLKGARAVAIPVLPVKKGYRPFALGIEGRYDRLGSIDGIRNTESPRALLAFFQRALKQKAFVVDEKYLRVRKHFPIKTVEQLLGGFERNMNDGMTHALWRGQPVMFSMVVLEVARALGAKGTLRGSPDAAKHVFDDAALALEIYDGRWPKLAHELNQLGALSAFVKAKKIAWWPSCGDDQHHPVDMRKRLAAARKKFKNDPAVLAALKNYEREVRDGLVDEDDD